MRHSGAIGSSVARAFEIPILTLPTMTRGWISTQTALPDPGMKVFIETFHGIRLAQLNVPYETKPPDGWRLLDPIKHEFPCLSFSEGFRWWHEPLPHLRPM